MNTIINDSHGDHLCGEKCSYQEYCNKKTLPPPVENLAVERKENAIDISFTGVPEEYMHLTLEYWIVYRKNRKPELPCDGYIKKIDAISGLVHNTITESVSEKGRYGVRVYIRGINGFQTSPKMSCFTDDVKSKIWGIRVDKNDPDPEKRVTYIFDAVGKKPAKMNYATGKFDYGDWGEVWFVKENKPCMLKSDGTVDYYLDPDDNSKKADGTLSDVNNIEYDGNAMAEFPLIWMKQYDEGDYEYILVSQEQVDNDFHAYPFHRSDGSIANKLYLRMFEGSYDGTKLRSISGQTLMLNQTAMAEIARAEKNGPCWFTNAWCEWDMINSLLQIISKSTNSQKSFGGGYNEPPVTSSLITGTTIRQGQFAGSSDNINAVKVFHMENWWGNSHNRIQGICVHEKRIHVKMTLPYNLGGVDYEDCGFIPDCSVYSYLSRQHVSRLGKLPFESKGTDSTFYCDAGYVVAVPKEEHCATVGSGKGSGLLAGASAITIGSLNSFTSSTHNACLSARPPKTE